MSSDPNAYITVFDLSQAGYRQWTGPVFGLVFVAVSIGLVVYELRFRSERKTRRIVFAYFSLAFAVLWTGTVAFGTYSEFWKLRHALQTGEVQYVEGPVENFVPMPVGGHAMEHFEVNGKRFEYSDFVMSAGFNKSASHGGPIRAGRQVRVGYVGDSIVRLQVAP